MHAAADARSFWPRGPQHPGIAVEAHGRPGQFVTEPAGTRVRGSSRRGTDSTGSPSTR
jgi:hypothetical protein